MALFVRASRIAPIAAEQAPAPLTELSRKMPAFTRPPGFFGRLGNRLRNADWQMAFAQMRDDPSFAENLLAHRENAAEQARREAEAESQRRVGKQSNETLEALIANEPPEVQAMARLDPESYIRRRMGGDNSGWEGGAGFTNAYRIGPDGQVETGGALPLRPYAPRSDPRAPLDVPPGFELE